MIDKQKFINIIDLSDLIYLHSTAYTTVRVINARQDRPQPTINVIEGMPEYSMLISLGC